MIKHVLIWIAIIIYLPNLNANDKILNKLIQIGYSRAEPDSQNHIKSWKQCDILRELKIKDPSWTITAVNGYSIGVDGTVFKQQHFQNGDQRARLRLYQAKNIERAEEILFGEITSNSRNIPAYYIMETTLEKMTIFSNKNKSEIFGIRENLVFSLKTTESEINTIEISNSINNMVCSIEKNAPTPQMLTINLVSDSRELIFDKTTYKASTSNHIMISFDKNSEFIANNFDIFVSDESGLLDIQKFDDNSFKIKSNSLISCKIIAIAVNVDTLELQMNEFNLEFHE